MDKIFLCLLLIMQPALASNDVVNTITKNTISENSEINTINIATARSWQLNESEWARFLQLMKGYSGHYYQALSPPTVLGINAETSNDIQHFAEVAVRFEHAKLERELRFNAAFQRAAAKLYAKEPVIKSFDITPFTPIPSSYVKKSV